MVSEFIYFFFFPSFLNLFFFYLDNIMHTSILVFILSMAKEINIFNIGWFLKIKWIKLYKILLTFMECNG